ncbi:uncharacterized protein LOC136031697 isoform X3 [Artemia franciscana]|uniref:uncharacterized protein LOC136031697 isoform X3 n=1 Tax=Artemia franciscana TaxID=6661 RepID=UPI0032DA6AB8
MILLTRGDMAATIKPLIRLSTNSEQVAKHTRLLKKGVNALLPEHYKKFYLGWKSGQEEPVHFISEQGRWKKNPETGEIGDMAANIKPLIRLSTNSEQVAKHTRLLKKGVNALLPEHYKKFYLEWKSGQEEPVHFIPEQGRWKKNPETGEIQKVVNVQIPLKYPKEFDEGLWGGEGVIQGFKKRHPKVRRFSHFWVPTLYKRVVYSEILDKRYEVTCTLRFLELVDKHYGFDNYILETPPQDLKSVLALKFKREMLVALANENIYPEDPIKKKEVITKGDMAANIKPLIRLSTNSEQVAKHTRLLKKGVNALLPEHYKKFYLEWKSGQEEPVHFIPEQGRWKKNPETGEIQKVVNVQIPLKYPKEFDEGLWGGEGVIQGFKKRHPKVRRFSHFWVPTLYKRVVYSEILDKRYEVTCTLRFLELVDKHYGFDNYILETPPQDLKSVLALKFKREMLVALANENIYPEDPIKKKEVITKGDMAANIKPLIRLSTNSEQVAKHTRLLKKGVNALLPEHYKKFYLEWKSGQEEPVHFIPEQGRWKKNPETGEIQKVVNVQIPLKYPKEFDEGLWGGEGVIQGFKKRHPKVRRFSHFWVPTLYKRVVYSEILDKRYEVTCTLRFLELVDKHYGFDNYILELEEAEWYGLTLEEAVEKLRDQMARENPIQPLKIQLRKQLLEQLKSGALDEEQPIPQDNRSWMSTLNPFSKSS